MDLTDPMNATFNKSALLNSLLVSLRLKRLLWEICLR